MQTVVVHFSVYSVTVDAAHDYINSGNGRVQPGSLMGACGGEWRVEGDGNLYLRNYRKQSLYCCE